MDDFDKIKEEMLANIISKFEQRTLELQEFVPVKTGDLKRSIQMKQDDASISIFTDCEYATNIKGLEEEFLNEDFLQ